ncbi:MAG: CDP-alcohol phosphatidyltransferase family protein [Actinomycetota bacterium]
MAATPETKRVVTIPNFLSLIRILLIPLFVVLLFDEDTRLGAMFLLGGLQATDWVDGWVARRFGQVSSLGKVLDPFADRLLVASALVSFVWLEAFPLWAALLILVRDAAILLAGAALMVLGRPQLEVRRLGKIATFTLMWGGPLIAWGNFGFLLDDAALVLGWIWFLVGVIEYYAATVLYVGDFRRVLAAGKPA